MYGRKTSTGLQNQRLLYDEGFTIAGARRIFGKWRRCFETIYSGSHNENAGELLSRKMLLDCAHAARFLDASRTAGIRSLLSECGPHWAQIRVRSTRVAAVGRSAAGGATLGVREVACSNPVVPTLLSSLALNEFSFRWSSALDVLRLRFYDADIY